jgi:hypothetical protein
MLVFYNAKLEKPVMGKHSSLLGPFIKSAGSLHNTKQVSLPTLLVCLLCFMLTACACSTKLILAAATNCANKTKKDRQYVSSISLFLI